MSTSAKRLPGILPRRELVYLLAPTYAAARGVDEDIAEERLGRALAAPAALADVLRGIEEGLLAARGPRTTEDALLDKLSAGVLARRGKVRPAAATPAISAALVRLDLETGLAPESMRDTLAAGRGRELLAEGLRALGAHLVKELLR